MANPLDSVAWIHGAPNCGLGTDPFLQTHQFDDDTYVFRQSKCFTFEGPFQYLLFGNSQVILFDTGGPPGPPLGRVLPIRKTVDEIIARWLARTGRSSVKLVVAHTHGHGDHSFGDSQFVGRPNTTIIKPDLAPVKRFFGLRNWPNGQAIFDLGGRQLTILPIPGHQDPDPTLDSHIAVYDSHTQWLLTGDSLYAGMLVVRNWAAYRESIRRLDAFAATHTVLQVLGCHIEMKRAARELYPIGTTFQPDEHALPLTRAHLRELAVTLASLPTPPRVDVIRDDFIIHFLRG